MTQREEPRTPEDLARFIVEYEFHNPSARYKSEIELTAYYAQLIESEVSRRVVEVLSELEQNTSIAFIAPTQGVTLRAIQEVKGRYQGE